MIIEKTKALGAEFDKKIKKYFPDIASEAIFVKLEKLNEKHHASLNQVDFRNMYGKVLIDSVLLKMTFTKHFIKGEKKSK